MAKNDDPKARALTIVRSLVQVADGDTVFRDLYLEHAAAQLAELLPEATYRALCGSRAQIDLLVRQTQAAVQSQDWPRVKQLSAQADGLRQSLQQNADLVDLAQAAYDAEAVKLDPFSAGLAEGGPRTSAAALRNALVTTLAELAKADPAWGELYKERREFFASLAVIEGPAKAEGKSPKVDLADLQQRARATAARGEVEHLKELAEQIMRLTEEAKKAAAAAPSTPAEHATAPAAVGRQRISTEPFPAPCLERAAALGLEHVHLQARFAEMPAAMSDFMAQRGWQPHANAEELAKEGAVHLRAQLANMELPTELKEPFVELATLFCLRPFVNSAGVRYFPPEPGEYVLLETFPENAEPPQSELLTLLGLPRRRALSRVEIEGALQRHGAEVLEQRLGLPRREFRIVCLPFDVYVRAGAERGWGQQQQWTHVDGYGVNQRGRLGALAAGDVRYGGLFDLVILSSTDQRDSVVARFAVVRRIRLQGAF